MKFLVLAVCAALLLGRQAVSAPDPGAAEAAPAKESAPGKESTPAKEPAPAEPVPAPEPPAAAEAEPGQPLYSLHAVSQDAEAVVLEFARRAGRTVLMADRYRTLISVQFKDLPFEQGLRRILQAADWDFLKDAEGYHVGLPNELQLRTAQPGDKVDAVYRCRRVNAGSLVKTIQAIFGDADLRASTGPEFLTPQVESASSGTGDITIKALGPTDTVYRTHDVVFSGTAAMVRRALNLARKFDVPRKQVRVNVRIVEMSSNAERNLGVAWQQSMNLTGVELANPNITGNPGSSPLANGIQLGKFAHTPVTLTATINALETAGEAKTISNPTLMVLDGEKSFILSGTKYVYPRLINKDNSGQPLYDISTEKLGIYLQVGVQIGLDEDMVLSIYPQVSSLVRFQSINGGNYPIITTREEQATVRANKGDVIVLGGLTEDDRTRADTSLPFLSHIPLLGSLFSSRDSVHTTEELVIFLTPEIVQDTEAPLDLQVQVQPGG